jgi:tetratricopeptide (TPR) repeat protein
MHSRIHHVALSGLLFLSTSITVSRTAWADPTAADKAAAETLFVDGRKLMSAGKYQEACKAFAESQRLDSGVGTLLNLGRCYEKLGRTASAWSTYREAASAARASNQSAREKNARAAADALEPKLPKLTIVVLGTETNVRLEVRRDGAVVPSSMWGMSVAIDPGEHTFEATAPGRKPWHSKVVAEAAKPIKVTVPDLEVDPKTTPVGKATSTETAPVAKSKTPEAPPPEPSGLGGQRIAALVVGGVGVVGTAVGGYFALRARAANDRANCDENNICQTQADLDEHTQAIKLANSATYATAGGLIALATGVVLWVTAPAKPSTDSASAITPRRLWISADPLGETGARSVTVGGVF